MTVVLRAHHLLCAQVAQAPLIFIDCDDDDVAGSGWCSSRISYWESPGIAQIQREMPNVENSKDQGMLRM